MKTSTFVNRLRYAIVGDFELASSLLMNEFFVVAANIVDLKELLLIITGGTAWHNHHPQSNQSRSLTGCGGGQMQ